MHKLIKCLIPALMLFGCENIKEQKHNLETVTILSHKNMNQNSVVRIDLVQIFNANLWSEISKMSSKQYFKSKKDLMTKNQSHMRVWSFEPLPETQIKSFAISCWHPLCFGAVMFLSYASNKKHVIIVPRNQKHISLDLGEREIDRITYNFQPNSDFSYIEMEKINEQKV